MEANTNRSHFLSWLFHFFNFLSQFHFKRSGCDESFSRHKFLGYVLHAVFKILVPSLASNKPSPVGFINFQMKIFGFFFQNISVSKITFNVFFFQDQKYSANVYDDFWFVGFYTWKNVQIRKECIQDKNYVKRLKQEMRDLIITVNRKIITAFIHFSANTYKVTL